MLYIVLGINPVNFEAIRIDIGIAEEDYLFTHFLSFTS